VPLEPQKGLGKAVRRLREEARISQRDLADRAGVPISEISRIEAGAHDPTWGDMRQVASALGVSMERLSEIAEEFERS
jgi:transcriptional regulator with XRE-family HTH domain